MIRRLAARTSAAVVVPLIPLQSKWRESTEIDWMTACKHCRHNTQHPETWAPKKGSGSKRVGAKEGFTGQAIRNRIPRKLAVEIAVSMMSAVETRGLAVVDE